MNAADAFLAAYERQAGAHEDVKARHAYDRMRALSGASNAIEHEIAVLLHDQQANIDEAAHLARLSVLIKHSEATFGDSPRVDAALKRARAKPTPSSLMALDRELRRQFEEEEMAVLMTFATEP